MAMPAQKPGRSKQDYQTPEDFLDAARGRLGIVAFDIDLAADESNTVAERWFDQEQNSLVQPWHQHTQAPAWAWLNQPFGNMAPWVKKCWMESQLGVQIAQLVPAGVGSNWWRDWVHLKAQVLLLNGRITFVGESDPYIKDCCLLLWGPDFMPRYDVWTWTTSAAGSGGSSRGAARAG